MQHAKILRRAEVCQRCGIGRTTLQKLEDAGKFPARVKLTESTVGWVEAEVSEWINARIAASRRQAVAA